MEQIIREIESCRVCEEDLPLGPRPILSVQQKSKIIIIGQAPGSIVHKSGIPWDDKSGENLRRWMGINNEVFYDASKIALIPMGFCYPGKGKSGDNPPRKECAPLWHQVLLNKLNEVELTILIGKYAQEYYLGKTKDTLTELVKNYNSFLPQYLALPHPSPRNNIWQAKNPWFKEDVLPELKNRIRKILN